MQTHIHVSTYKERQHPVYIKCESEFDVCYAFTRKIFNQSS